MKILKFLGIKPSYSTSSIYSFTVYLQSICKLHSSIDFREKPYHVFDTRWWDRDGRSEIPSRSEWPSDRKITPVRNQNMAPESNSSNKDRKIVTNINQKWIWFCNNNCKNKHETVFDINGTKVEKPEYPEKFRQNET